MNPIKDTTSTVDAIAAIPRTGDIVSPSLFSRIVYTTKRGIQCNHLSVLILCNILYWYMPTIKRNEKTGRVISVKKKFASDKLQRGYSDFAEQFATTKDVVRDAIALLRAHGLVNVEMRTVKSRGGRNLPNIMFIEPVPDRVSTYIGEFTDIGELTEVCRRNNGYMSVNSQTYPGELTDTLHRLQQETSTETSTETSGATRQKNDASNETPETHNAPAQTHGSVAPGAVTRAMLTAFQTFCMEHDLAVIAAWPDVYRDADHVARLAQFGHAQYLAELQAANGAKWKRKVKSGHRTLINWFKRIDAGTSLHNPAAVPDDRLLLAKKMATIYRVKYQETNNVPTKIKATDRDVLLELSDLIDETNPGADRLMAWGKWVDMLMLMTPTRKDAFDWRSKPLRGLLNNYGMITAQMMKTHAPMQAMSAAERESANVQNDILVQAARQAAADMEERRQEKERKAAAKRAARRAEIEANGGYDIYGRKVIFKD